MKLSTASMRWRKRSGKQASSDTLVVGEQRCRPRRKVNNHITLPLGAESSALTGVSCCARAYGFGSASDPPPTPLEADTLKALGLTRSGAWTRRSTTTTRSS